MPDFQTDLNDGGLEHTLREFVPPVLTALGALSLLRMSRFFSLAIAGIWLYELAARSDSKRERRGLNGRSQNMAAASMDDMIEDSFPASDPPSFSGSTAGAP